jgi:hypothetical protein
VSTPSNRSNRQRGQTLVVVALALIPLLTMTGLVIDGGYAFTQQRRTQNAMDAAANAGAVVMVQNLPFRVRGQAQPRTDTEVYDEIVAVANSNGVTDTLPTAVYTDIDGNPLAGPIVVGDLGAVPPPDDAYGVEVEGSIPFGTFFAGVAGFSGFTASARAAAVAGAITNICAATESCGFIPVTFPTALTTCDGTGAQTAWGSGGAYALTDNPVALTEVIIPLCGTANGTVGWLNIEPDNPDCNGEGADELACNILAPVRQELSLPIWIDAYTGNINSNGVQDALNTFTGPTVGVYEPGLDKIVQIPLYDCIDNNIPQSSPGPACPTPPLVGVGTNTSYRVVAIGAMILDKAYIQGNNPECNQTPGGPPAGGNGSTGCLKGWLTQIITTGTVGIPTSPDGTVWGVQLVR